VEERLSRGIDVILEIDPQGAAQVKRSVPSSMLVFITAPSMEELRRRLEHRGSETEEQMERRLRTAEAELSIAGTYDFVVQNDDVRRATDELQRIIESDAGPGANP
jgi:guanylate kinase